MTTQKYGCKSLEDDSMRRVNENQSDKSKEKGKKKKKVASKSTNNATSTNLARFFPGVTKLS